LTRSTLPGVVAAALWLRRILPLFDCTLPQAAFKYNKEPVIQVKGGNMGKWTLWNDYGIVHIKSGTLLLQNTVPTLVEAGMWLRTMPSLIRAKGGTKHGGKRHDAATWAGKRLHPL
jgi:hypothetical protein